VTASRPARPSALWRSLRWPVTALVVVGLLLMLAFALDTGSEGARDAALLIGAPTLYLLLPLAVLWLIVALVRHWRRRD
jgi:hypothetical protein